MPCWCLCGTCCRGFSAVEPGCLCSCLKVCGIHTPEEAQDTAAHLSNIHAQSLQQIHPCIYKPVIAAGNLPSSNGQKRIFTNSMCRRRTREIRVDESIGGDWGSLEVRMWLIYTSDRQGQRRDVRIRDTMLPMGERSTHSRASTQRFSICLL